MKLVVGQSWDSPPPSRAFLSVPQRSGALAAFPLAACDSGPLQDFSASAEIGSNPRGGTPGSPLPERAFRFLRGLWCGRRFGRQSVLGSEPPQGLRPSQRQWLRPTLGLYW